MRTRFLHSAQKKTGNLHAIFLVAGNAKSCIHVILSEAKDLSESKKLADQILRYAQNDTIAAISRMHSLVSRSSLPRSG